MDKYEYQYDSAGNQTSKTEKIDGTLKGTTTYTYDDLNRLESVTEPSERCTEYTYDKSGNRAIKTVTEEVYSVTEVVYSVYEYDSCNLLEKITKRKDDKSGVILEVFEYTYDDNGNTTKEKWTEYIDGVAQPTQVTAEYEYDWLNRQTSAEADGVEVTSEYNGEGLRVEKQVGGNTSRYLYEYSKVVLELDGEGEVSAKNTYGLNLISREIDSDKYYYLYNGNADVTGLVTVTGEVYGTYYYDAFGNIIDETGGADNPFRYKGYQYDEETGLYYLNSRMYDPVTARFLQEDTYNGNPRDPLNLNLYTYCHNEPIMYSDPTGHNDIENVERLLNDIIQYKKNWREIEEEIKNKPWFEGWWGPIPFFNFNKFYFLARGDQTYWHEEANKAREEIKQSDLYKNNPVFQAEYDKYLKKKWGGTFEDVRYLIELLESPQLISTPTSISTVETETVETEFDVEKENRYFRTDIWDVAWEVKNGSFKITGADEFKYDYYISDRAFEPGFALTTIIFGAQVNSGDIKDKKIRVGIYVWKTQVAGPKSLGKDVIDAYTVRLAEIELKGKYSTSGEEVLSQVIKLKHACGAEAYHYYMHLEGLKGSNTSGEAFFKKL